jgi:hypothetical protein
MTTTTFGEISYADDIYGGKQSTTNNKDLFLRLSDGSNEVRLVTAPHQYMVHKVKKDPNNPKDYGRKVKCSMVHGSCPICETGDKPKARWFYGVIDRKTGTYKILDISYAVFSNIRTLARNTARWGDPTKYDIDIIVNKNGSPANYYAVQPVPKEPLSATDQQLKDNADLEDLKRRCTPPTAEQVMKQVNDITGGAPLPTASSTAETKKAAPKAPTASMTDEDEGLGDDFPEYTTSA